MACNCGGGMAERLFLVMFPDGTRVWCANRELASAAIIDAGGGTATEIVGPAAEVLKGHYTEWTAPAATES